MNNQPYTYTLYGLTVHADIPLPATPAPTPDNSPPDLRIHWGERRAISPPPDLTFTHREKRGGNRREKEVK
jgi:hypothetical protein